MIARNWHGRVPAAQADAYFAYLQRSGIPDYRRTPGNRGVYGWDSLDAIRAFAGDDLERARYYSEDTAYLLELEPKVTHYEVLVAP